jgi:Zn-dependent protease with chaperone function
MTGAASLSPAELEACEANVETLYRRARAGPGEVWRPSKMALALFGAPGVVFRAGIPELGWLARRGASRVVVVQGGLSRPILEWVVGHELGHWVRGSAHGDPLEELRCDYIGAAIQMRRAVFLARAKAVKGNLAQLAFDFGTTQTSAALRLGELTARGVAVVLPERIYTRGSLTNEPHERLRRWSELPAPGLRRAVLTDASDARVLLTVARRG